MQRATRLNRSAEEPAEDSEPDSPIDAEFTRSLHGHLSAIRLAIAAVMLTWIFYDTTAEMMLIPFRNSSAAHQPHRTPRAVSHCQPVRPVRRDDQRSL